MQRAGQFEGTPKREDGDSSHWLRYAGKNISPWPSAQLDFTHKSVDQDGSVNFQRKIWRISTQAHGSVIATYETGTNSSEDMVTHIYINDETISGESAPRGVWLGAPHDKGRSPVPLSEEESRVAIEQIFAAFQTEIDNLSK